MHFHDSLALTLPPYLSCTTPPFLSLTLITWPVGDHHSLSPYLSLTLITRPVGDHQQLSFPVLHKVLDARLAGSHQLGRAGGMMSVDKVHLAVGCERGGGGRG